MKLIVMSFILLLGITLAGLIVVFGTEDSHLWDSDEPYKRKDEELEEQK